MMELFNERPGLIYVVATLLPLASFLLLLLAGGVRNYLRFGQGPAGLPGRIGAYVATAAIALAFICSLAGFLQYHGEHEELEKEIRTLKNRLAEVAHKADHATGKEGEELEKQKEGIERALLKKEGRWSGSVSWARIVPFARSTQHPGGLPDPDQGSALRVGYHIDYLSALMFLMVTFIASLIHLFSIGYMGDELHEVVEDHEVHVGHGHLHRRGRFGRFFLFLSLFCFSMLNLILADNLFQVFVSWELVGLCSYLLIGFYFERTSAGNAANKAFITNRIGDAGFIIGMLIIWTYIGTFNFQEIFARVRSPMQALSTEPEEEGKPPKQVRLGYAGQIVRGEVRDHWQKKADGRTDTGSYVVAYGAQHPVTMSTQAILFPHRPEAHFYGVGPGGLKEAKTWDRLPPDAYGAMPYWLLVAAGLGIFLGCMGKSAQFPLHVWLPDAMEGPTPVSALIHAATMVAAGVYLVGRVYPLFTPEAQLAIAYTGGITLFVAATIAVVMNDIKKVLAYSTVSQLGYMMLGLGVGDWVAGLFHLFTHAFFKALLFLGSGSVIFGCHHEQDMMKMGGLYPKMKITALTMLAGVLAIGGIPLFSGWYSKDAIIVQSFGFAMVHKQHLLLFLLPLVTAGLTAFYMFRLWLLTFAGKPRDEHIHEHAHESPWVMTVPLTLLAIFSIGVAWGWPVWDAHKSELGHMIKHSMPATLMADFGVVPHLDVDATGALLWEGGPAKDLHESERHVAYESHFLVGNIALAVVLIGITFAFLLYYYRVLDPAEAKQQFPAVHRFLWNKWYFDELYSAILVRPALAVANWCRAFDSRVIDGSVNNTGRFTVWFSWLSGRFDFDVVDGLVNLTARVCYAVGNAFHRVQTGYLRSYVLFLVLAAVGIWILLSFFLGAPAAGGH
jgi:NADH-quinone oxidoreductase subunit L